MLSRFKVMSAGPSWSCCHFAIMSTRAWEDTADDKHDGNGGQGGISETDEGFAARLDSGDPDDEQRQEGYESIPPAASHKQGQHQC